MTAESGEQGLPEAEWLAQEQRISISEAESRIRLLAAFNTHAGELKDLVGQAFGGYYIDPTSDRPVLNVTGDVERQRAAVDEFEQKYPQLRDGIDIRGVRFSFAELTAERDEWNAKAAKANERSPYPIAFGASAVTNNVVVFVSPLGELTETQQAVRTDARNAGVEERSGSTSGPAAACGAYTQGGVTTSRCDSPLRGGVSIQTTSSAYIWNCSLGFYVRSANTTNTNNYFLSAGHCYEGAPATPAPTVTAQIPTGGRYNVGTRVYQNFNNSVDVSLSKVAPTGVLPWTIQTWVYHTTAVLQNGQTTTGSDSYDIGTTPGTLAELTPLCKMGAFSHQTYCGRISGPQVPFTERVDATGTQHTLPLWPTNLCVTGGDSGGPNYYAHQAYGITTAEGDGSVCPSNSNYGLAWIQDINDLLDYYNLRLP